MSSWIDTHCHLTERYLDGDLEDIVIEAAEAGVERLVNIGCGPGIDHCREAVGIAERFDNVWASVGMHPHEADGADDAFFEELVELAKHPRVVAIGESGLDYHYDNSARDNQRASFRRHFEIAAELKKPLIIHNRDSDEDCIEILREHRESGVSGVVHCFSSSWELAEVALEQGFYLGFTGIVSFKNAKAVREVLRRAPRDRIVVETDSPFLAPVPHRGKRNRPLFVKDVGVAVAEALDISVSEAARVTTENAFRLYGWDSGEKVA